jgi:hypothetical protein
MPGFNNKAGPDGLLTIVVLQTKLLNLSLQRLPKKISDSKVYASIHQAKGVGGAHYAVEGRDLLEASVKNLDFWIGLKGSSPSVAKLYFGVGEN